MKLNKSTVEPARGWSGTGFAVVVSDFTALCDGIISPCLTIHPLQRPYCRLHVTVNNKNHPWQPPLHPAVNLCSHKVLIFTMSDNHKYAWDLKWGRMCLGANTAGGLPRRDVKISSLLLYMSNLISSTVLLGQEWSNILWCNWSKSWQDKRITKLFHLIMSNSYLLFSAHRRLLCAELNYPVEFINLWCPMTFSIFTAGSFKLSLIYSFTTDLVFVSDQKYWCHSFLPQLLIFSSSILCGVLKHGAFPVLPNGL